MKITPWDIYWITRLDDVSVFFGIGGGALLLFGGILAAAYWVGKSQGELNEWANRWQIAFLATLPPAVGFLFVVTSTLLPSTKQAAAMILIPKIAANEQVQKLPDNLMALANDWIEELKPKSKDSK